MVANYTFNSGSAASSDSHAQSTAGQWAISGGTASGGTSPQAAISSSTDQPYIRTLSLTNSKLGAISGEDYFSFTWTPDAGFTTPLTELRFAFGGSNLGANGSDPSDNYTAYLSAQASVGGGSYFDIGQEISRLVTYQAGNSGAQLSNYTINLGGIPALQNTTEAVNFRFYLYSSTSHDGKIVRMDNVVLDTVPEPSAAALALLGSVYLLRRKRSH